MPAKPTVILDPYGRKRDLIFWPEDLERLHEFADVVWGRDEMMPDEEVAQVRDEAVAIIAGHWHHGDLAQFPKLRAFIEVGGGLPSVNSIDYPQCFARGIRVLSCAPAFAPAVAEMGLALALASCRRVCETNAAFRTGTENWSHEQVEGPFQMWGKPIGFIGYGNISRTLHRLVAPFGGHVRAYDPWITPTAMRQWGVESADLDTVLKESRFVFVLAVPTKDNEALLSEEKLAMLRPDSVLVLLSRAQIADFDALVRMTAAGHFRVALDVFPDEPLVADHPIRQVPSAVLSSHRAGAQSESLRNIGRLVVNDLEAIVQGLPPQFLQSAQPELLQRRGI